MHRSIALGIIALICASATAQDAPSEGWKGAAGPAPAVEAAPARSAVETAIPYLLKKLSAMQRLLRSVSALGSCQREAQLRTAAEHLIAAGLEDDAARYRELADAEPQRRKQALLAEKLAEIKLLQAEIAELHRTPADELPIFLDVKIYEVDRGKVKDLGFDRGRFGDEKQQSAWGSLVKTVVLASNDRRLGTLHGLVRNKLAKVLVEPSIVTNSGRRVTMQMGEEVPVLVRHKSGVDVSYRKVGTTFEFLPEQLEDGMISLEFRVDFIDVDHNHNDNDAESLLTGFFTRTFDAAVEIEPGKTIVLCGIWQERDESNSAPRPDSPDQDAKPSNNKAAAAPSREIVILVTPTVVRPDATVKTAIRPR